MKILVTGGTGVIGQAAVTELIGRGHSVRLLSRHADQDAARWSGVEPFSGNVAEAGSLQGAADGCDAVLHIAGVASEKPPEITFESVNIGGTRNIVAEAERAGAHRFVIISSLGADTGASDYHRSKLAAEKVVESSSLQWTVMRPGNVYGPGDEVISTILKLVRALPAVPVIDGGDQKFQPVWHEDLAKAIANVLEQPDLVGNTIEVAGVEVTTTNDLIDRVREITGRKPLRISIPSSLAALSAKLAGLAVDVPIDETKLAMLREENVIRGRNALTSRIGIAATPLDEGLKRLADEMPEQLASEGVGKLQHKRYSAIIGGTKATPETLITLFRERIVEIMPMEFAAEPGVPERADLGVTLTASLPVRGHIQVRVEKVEPRRVVFAALQGHPIAGTVEFSSTEAVDGVRFSIDIYSRSANFFDLAIMKTVGAVAQDANWRSVVRRVGEAAGGKVGEVEHDVRTLDEDEAATREDVALDMVHERIRAAQ